MDLCIEQVQRVCPKTPSARVAEVSPFLESSLLLAEINTPLRAAMYLAQLAHESNGFQSFEENLNYSAERLMLVWPHRFPALVLAKPYEHNPEKLANHCYADRLGNGDEASGDGWRYRGRGAIQITGCDTYHAAGDFLGLDLRGQPEVAAMPEHAFTVAAWFWRTHGLNAFADKGDVAGATRRINGGLGGLPERQLLFDAACEALGALSLHPLS